MIELTIVEHQSEGVTILGLNGDVTFGTGNLELRKSIRRLLRGQKENSFKLQISRLCGFKRYWRAHI